MLTSLKSGHPKRRRFYQDLGKRIKEKRLKKGFSQNGVATAIGLSRTSLTNIEKGRQNLLLHTFLDIADALQVKAKDLLPEEANPSEDMQKKLNAVAPEFRDFVKQTIGEPEQDEHINNTSESNPTSIKNGHQKRARGR